MPEYRDRPKTFHKPTKDELKARNKRSVAIALALALFMIFVFVTMVSRGCLLYTSPSPRDGLLSRMPSSA